MTDSKGDVGAGSTLQLDPEVSAKLLLGGKSHEDALTAVFEVWIQREQILSAAVYLRRPEGWSLLLRRRAESTPADSTTEETAILRLLCEPSLPHSSEADLIPGVDGRFAAFGLHHREDEAARLIVELPADTSISLERGTYVHLALFIGGLKDRELLDAISFQGGYCRRLLVGRSVTEDPQHIQKDFPDIIGRSPAIAEVLGLVRRAAPRDVTILVEGESGTGKELIGRAVHRLSTRSSGPFISENCAAVSESLLEAELFGHVRGAFTGAHQSRPGLIERSHRGTLLLDEIGEMSPGLQSKLLRVLEEREVRRVGSTDKIPVDFRFLSATHRDLEAEAAAGRFRLDLLYRIQVIRIRLPALRERPEDIPLLVHHFVHVLSKEHGIQPPKMHEEAMRLLCGHSWPGNIRELRNEIQRALTLNPEIITPDSLSPTLEKGLVAPSLAKRMRERFGANIYGLERILIGGVIREILRETGGNKAEAARILGLPKSNLYRRIRKYGIQL